MLKRLDILRDLLDCAKWNTPAGVQDLLLRGKREGAVLTSQSNVDERKKSEEVNEKEEHQELNSGPKAIH
jgi:hypothetical protein